MAEDGKDEVGSRLIDRLDGFISDEIEHDDLTRYLEKALGNEDVVEYLVALRAAYPRLRAVIMVAEDFINAEDLDERADLEWPLAEALRALDMPLKEEQGEADETD